MPAKKTRKQTRKPPSSSSSASTNGAQHADSAAAELELEPDALRNVESLAAFLDAPPRFADRVSVGAWYGHDAPLVPIQTRAREEVDAAELAAAIVRQCARWDTRRRMRFEIRWLRDEHVLASLIQEYGADRSGGVELDGSVRSFLAQQQSNSQAQHKLHLEGFEMVQEGWRSLLSLQNKRIEGLEKDNAELREKLRKADDVGSEIAIESARAEIEARGRTADILEKRLLPIAEAIAVQKIREMAGAASQQPAQQVSPAAPVPVAGLREVHEQ